MVDRQAPMGPSDDVSGLVPPAKGARNYAP